MLSQAIKEGPAKSEELIARMRKASEKTPADARALWDWFYLCLMRNDNAGAYRRRQDVEPRPGDRSARALGLSAITGRPADAAGPARRRVRRRVAAQQKDDTPPLDKDELDHVMECYRGLRARRPELAQAQILQYVDDELKRAKRVDDEEQFYREAVAGATQLGQIAGAFNLAAARGDADALILLADRLDRLQTGTRHAGLCDGRILFLRNGPLDRPGDERLRQKKAYADVLRLLDHQLASVRRKQERQSPGAARAARRGWPAGRPAASYSDLGRQDDSVGDRSAFPSPTSTWMTPRSRSCARRSSSTSVTMS